MTLNRCKRIFSAAILAGSLLVSSFWEASASDQPAVTFKDVKADHPNAVYISELVQKGLIDGTGEGMFSPETSLTREQFAKMVVQVFSVPLAQTTAPFQDVSSRWSAPYVNTAYAGGLMNGVSDGVFAPEQILTRQEAAAIVWRYLASQGIAAFSGGASAAVDADEWAKSAVSNVVGYGLRTERTSDLVYRSLSPMTRGEATALLVLSRQLLDKKPEAEASSVNATSGKSGGISDIGQGNSMADAAVLTFPAHIAPKGSAWYKLNSGGRSIGLLFDEIVSMELRDTSNNIVMTMMDRSWLIEPEKAGTYFLIIHSKNSNLSGLITDGSLPEAPYELGRDGETVRLEANIPAGETAYFRLKTTEGSRYKADAQASPQTNAMPKTLKLLDKAGKTIKEANASSEVLTFVSETDPVIGLQAGDSAGRYVLKVSKQGQSMETAIGIAWGQENKFVLDQNAMLWLHADLSQAGTTLISISGGGNAALLDKNNNSMAETNSGSMRYTNLGSRFQQLDMCPCYLRLGGAKGKEITVKTMTGRSMGEAYPLSMRNGKASSEFEIYQTESVKAYYFQLPEAEAGKYRIEFKNGNAVLQRSVNTKTYTVPLVIEGVQQKIVPVKWELLAPDGKVLLSGEGPEADFEVKQQGMYYLRISPEENEKGNLFTITKR